jgi:RNA polymerase sigma factor (sigma-70 family)
MDLAKYQRTKAIIEQKKALIAELRRAGRSMFTDSVSGSFPDFPYTKHTIKLEGEDENVYKSDIAKIEREIADLHLTLAGHEQELRDYLANIPDDTERQILTCRYLYGWSESKIASTVNYSQPTVSRLLKKSLQEE